MTNKIHSCEISDSFVHPNNKLNDGKNGHGERRLYISSSNTIYDSLLKPWKFIVSIEYKSKIEDFFINGDIFKKQNIDRVTDVNNLLDKVEKMTISPTKQDGRQDVRRKYIGPYKEKENIQNWDKMRKILAPTKTLFEFFEKDDHIQIVINTNNIKLYNIPHGCSHIQIEWLNTISKQYNIEIQHAMNGGEFCLRHPVNGYMWPVDGYHCCDMHKCTGNSKSPCKYNKYVFEFQGTYWHKNKKDKDAKKKEFYESKGYKMIHKHEELYIQYNKLLKNIKNISIK